MKSSSSSDTLSAVAEVSSTRSNFREEVGEVICSYLRPLRSTLRFSRGAEGVANGSKQGIVKIKGASTKSNLYDISMEATNPMNGVTSLSIAMEGDMRKKGRPSAVRFLRNTRKFLSEPSTAQSAPRRPHANVS